MTRENKLALVTGFALILLVGILVSDHFSAAATEPSVDLLPVHDPLADSTRTDPELLRFDPPDVAAATWVQPESRLGPSRAAGPVGTTRRTPSPAEIRMPDLQAPTPAVALPADESKRLPYTLHDVRPGESLSSICQRHYADGSLAAALATYNGIDDPDRLSAGVRIRVPSAGDLVRGAAAPVPAATATATAPVPATSKRTYTVRPGDVLSVIASRELGSARRWRELYERNRDVIDDPDHVEVGTVLVLP